MKRAMYWITGIFIAILILLWAGLQFRPAPFAPFTTQSSGAFTTVPLPTDLPAPVARYYEHILGATPGTQPELPVITSAVISGRARLRLMGITFPARFRFSHRAGQDYRHYIEATWFGLPVMRVNERYLGGHGRMELPVGTIENEPNINQAANLGLWAESIWLPSIYITDPRVRWEPIDEYTALLRVPYSPAGESTPQEEHFVARFDPETGVLTMLESMRYKEADAMTKTLWINQTHHWALFEPWLLPERAALIWLDDGVPWADFSVEEVVYNVEQLSDRTEDLDSYLHRRGP